MDATKGKPGKFVVYKGRGTQPWRWRFVAANGRNVARSSEGYPTKRLATKSAVAVKYVALTSPIVDGNL